VIQIPIPGMIRHQLFMIASQAVQHPVRSRYMRIIVGAIDSLRCRFVPTRPCTPVEVAAIVSRRHIVRLVVEETLPHAVGMGTLFELQTAPQNSVDELLQFLQFLFVRLNEFFHDRRQPGSSAALIA
jgi:hypothetical protein